MELGSGTDLGFNSMMVCIHIDGKETEILKLDHKIVEENTQRISRYVNDMYRYSNCFLINFWGKVLQNSCNRAAA